MQELVSFGPETRELFDLETQRVLDLIQQHCAKVEIELPVPGSESNEQWFVQVYRVGNESVPEGFYGSTALESATRIAKALGIETGQI